MANMMAGIMLQGSADSGYGINLSGFHCPTAEYGGRLQELQDKQDAGKIVDIVSFEDNGYVTVVYLRREGLVIPSRSKMATLRREPHKFFVDLPEFLRKTKAQFVDRMTLTGSLGSISLTVLYRPVEEPGG